MAEALLVGTLTDEGIVNIGQGYDLGGNRDFVSDQSIWISFSIIALMMPAADLIRDIDQRFVFIAFHLAQHRRTDQGMLFHFLEFFFCQFSRLI